MHRLAKIASPDRERFVDDQDFRVNVNGRRKGQANVHAAGVFLDWPVDESANLAKASILGKAWSVLP